MKIEKGISFYITFGMPVMPNATFSKRVWRVAIGPVAIGIMFRDYESLLYNLCKKVIEYDRVFSKITDSVGKKQ